MLLIEILKISNTKKESQYILHNREVSIDGKRRKSISFPIGLFDVISLKDTRKNFRITIDNKGNFKAIDIGEKEAGIKPCKVTGKTLVKKKIQLNLSDGSNILFEKNEHKVGDTVIMDIVKKEIKNHLKLEKGNIIFLTGGKHRGSIGTIEDIIGSKIIYKIKPNEVYETLKKYAFVIGKEKPVIKLVEDN